MRTKEKVKEMQVMIGLRTYGAVSGNSKPESVNTCRLPKKK
jgi:hypothetical protein